MSQYLFESGIVSLSGRINLVTDKNDSFRNYINHSAKKDNLKYNIARSIARLITSIDLPKRRTENDLIEFLKTYCNHHDIEIDLEFLKEKNWIRIIFGTVEFPAQVARYFRLIEKGEQYQLSAIDETHINFLFEFKKNTESNIKVISKAQVLNVLSDEELQILVNREILKQNTSETLLITRHEYLNYLKNEIGAAFWLELSQLELDDSAKLEIYVNKIIRFGIYWPDKLTDFFENKELENLRLLAFNALISEGDLIDNGQEFHKMWLDAPLYSHIDLNQETPPFTVSGGTPYELFSNILELKHRHYWLYEEGESVRLKYGLLLNLVFQTSRINFNPHNVKKDDLLFSLLTDINKPYLIYHSCWIIQTYYQYLIPSLIADDRTCSISFILLNEIKIRENAIENDPNDPQFNSRKEDQLKTKFFKSLFNLFLDKISLNKEGSKVLSENLYNVLLLQSKNFYRNTSYTNQYHHLEERNRFEYFIKAIAEKRISGHFSGNLRPRMFPQFLPFLMDSLLNNSESVSHQYLGFNCSKFELIYQVLKFSKTSYQINELSEQAEEDLNIKRVSLIYQWKNLFVDYFIIDSIEVFSHDSKEKEIQKISRRSDPSGIEILNWGYFWAFLHENKLLTKILDRIDSSIVLDNIENEGAWSDKNVETRAKLNFLMKCLALGISEVHRNKPQFMYSFQGVDMLLNELQIALQQLTVKHCFNDLEHQRINVFDDFVTTFNNDLYYTSGIKLVFNALNKLDGKEAVKFYRKLLENDLNLLFLLTLLNLTESQEVIDLITNRINETDVSEFIKSVRNVDQWKNAIIEALHSSNHFEIASPIISKIEAWLEKARIPGEHYSNLIFRTKLMLAFKQKNIEEIIQLKRPSGGYITASPIDPLEEQRKFYLALHWGYNENDYLKAIGLFEQIISKNPNDTNSYYHIFHLGTLQNIESQNSSELNRLKMDWEQIVKNLEEKDLDDELKSIQPNINYTLLFHYCHFEDYNNIDRTLQNLDEILKYDLQVIELVFQSYIKRNLPVNATTYLSGIENYYTGSNSQIVDLIQRLRETFDNEDTISKLKSAYLQIYATPYKDLPKLVPSALNGKSNIQEFILQEILQASCILIEKIKSIDQIKWENKYNDLLLAILRLRFAVWNWDISDQVRAGISNSSGKDSGSLDFLIKSAGKSIALIEALILTSADKTNTHTHVKKCFDYLRHSKVHYVVVYFKGSDNNFDSSWKSYKSNVCSVDYEDKQKLISTDFENTSSETDTLGINTGITRHVNGVNMYHIYINIPLKTT